MFLILIIDCSIGALLKAVGYSITDEGMNQGNDGHGIFEATLIWAQFEPIGWL
jgi:hypothetical protein